MSGRADLVHRALGYPYAAPPASYALVEGEMLTLRDARLDLSGRRPLLAYGSNAAPRVLARKLAAVPDPLAVVRGELGGFDVVYSAHLASYGSVPATLWPSPRAVAPVFVAFVSAPQLEAIGATEPNYRQVELEDLRCRLETPAEVVACSAFISRHGPLLRGGAPVALAEVRTAGRELAEMGQVEAIDRVRRTVRPNLDLADFIAAAASDPILSRAWTQALRSHGGETTEGDAGEGAVGESEQS